MSMKSAKQEHTSTNGKESADYLSPPLFPADQPRDHKDETGDRAEAVLRRRLKTLSHEELVERVVKAERLLSKWHSAASDLVSAVALCPEMTEGFYARYLRQLLSSALLTLDVVHNLRHVECSMPCVKSETPSVQMVEWRDLQYSLWDIEWSPNSWWVSVSADGSRWGLGFNVLTRVSAIYLKGLLRCAFSADLSALRISFVQKPLLQMNVESSVGWGVVPIPVREQIEHLVRVEIERFVESRLTGHDSMVVVLRRKAREKLSDKDILEATEQAKRSSNVNLRSALLM